MLTLGIETTGMGASVALVQSGKLVAESRSPEGLRSAAWLAAAIDALLRTASVSPKQLDLVAVTQGPGSFTGLRVGITTAKLMAYSTGADCLGIHTLELLAQQAVAAQPPLADLNLHMVMDAQRSELFHAIRSPGGEISATSVIPAEMWLQCLESGSAITGPAVAKLAEKLPSHVTIAPPGCWQPAAAALALLAEQKFLAGERHDALSLLPQYYRPSYAEEPRRK